VVFRAGGGDMSTVFIIIENWSRNGNSPAIYGVFSTEEKANAALKNAVARHDESFSFYITQRDLDAHLLDSSEEVSLEERLEALEQYMNVAQQKIVALEARLGAYHHYTNGPSREELKRQWQIFL
jgi:hypothetical protein